MIAIGAPAPAAAAAAGSHQVPVLLSVNVGMPQNVPNVRPDQLTAYVDHVVPILQKRGVARTEYAGRTLRDHVGLPRPARTPRASSEARDER